MAMPLPVESTPGGGVDPAEGDHAEDEGEDAEGYGQEEGDDEDERQQVEEEPHHPEHHGGDGHAVGGRPWRRECQVAARDRSGPTGPGRRLVHDKAGPTV